jgi:DNA-binding NarL/FixJ family response regulator
MVTRGHYQRTLGTMDAAIRVLLVDDEPAIRRGLRMRLMLEPEIVIVGEAANGAAAIEMARLVRPDVVVMDVRMPVMDGIAATRSLTGGQECPAVIALSLYDDSATIAEALGAGACAFIAKSRMDSSLIDTIRRCAPNQPPSPDTNAA